MKIKNAKIYKVNVSVIFPGPKTTVNIETISTSGSWQMTFVVPNKQDLFLLRSLLEFACVTQTDKLEGRIIREVFCGSDVIGFGDPIEDKFVLFNKKEEFVSQSEIKI